ncbi:MAG: cysteine desulfurase, partial [Nanoarchaeota archaeon]
MIEPISRSDFPAFKANGFAFLDSAATTHKPSVVIAAMKTFYETINANVHRGMYRSSVRATEAYEQTRDEAHRFFGAPKDHVVVFTKGTTESLNLVANAWGLSNLKPGDEILLTRLEHHSQLLPWQSVAKSTGAVLRFMPLSGFSVSAKDAIASMTPRTKVIAMTHVSNAFGSLMPVKEICAYARSKGIVTLIDGAQSAGSMPVDIDDLGCDFFACSSHKMLGPTGVGVLMARRSLLEAMPPYQFGGEMIDAVTFDSCTFNDIPWKFEAGTPNIAGVIGFGAAIRYIGTIGLERIQRHDHLLTSRCLERLRALPDV